MEGAKLEEKTLEEFEALKLRLEELNKGAVRNKKFDFPVINEKWLHQFLRGSAKLARTS